jgi:hypothetical protein
MMQIILFSQTQDIPSRRASLLWLSFPRLNPIFSHRQWTIDSMQFEIETTGIANWFTFVVSSPQCCGSCAAVCTAQSQSSGCRLLKIKNWKLIFYVCTKKRGENLTVKIQIFTHT